MVIIYNQNKIIVICNVPHVTGGILTTVTHLTVLYAVHVYCLRTYVKVRGVDGSYVRTDTVVVHDLKIVEIRIEGGPEKTKFNNEIQASYISLLIGRSV